ncbi:MAG: RnfABCDGE type electron transport complex subunit B [Deltaproteobacteria bacterium]|nr:RnfABCDGE type electron transport complex subunit B [Deltaproteobacteria bacterium]
MNIVTILISAGTLLGLAVIFSYILGWASNAFKIEIDPRAEAALEVLPGANCGGCGYVGCGAYAAAVAAEKAAVNLCSVGGPNCAAELAAIMGVEVGETFPLRAVVHCGANTEDRLQRNEYRGEQKCFTANLVNGIQGCVYGCLGFGDCVEACNYDAIQVLDGLATVDYQNCIGCGMCAKACPRNIITIIPFKKESILVVPCSNHDAGKLVKSVCNVGCIGCKACTKVSKIFSVIDNLAVIDYDKYLEADSEELAKAAEKCPVKMLTFLKTRIK